jgi:hypothetical protein
MTKQENAYFSIAAAGTLAAGLTTRNTRGVPHLQRQPLSTKPRTEAQRDAAAFLRGLASAWTFYKPLIEPGWRTLPDFQNQDAYHNYVAANMARRASDLWPTLCYPPDPASPPATYNASQRLICQRGIQLVLDYTSTVPPRYVAFNIHPIHSHGITPKIVTYLAYTYLYDARKHLVRVPVGGDYALTQTIINRYGVAGTKILRYVTIPD